MKQGDIWIVELPSSDGHEQSGLRPVIVLAKAEANIAIIIPLTSHLQALRFPHTLEVKPSKGNGLSGISVALVFQIRAIDERRLKKKIGEVERTFLQEMLMMVKRLLGLQ